MLLLIHIHILITCANCSGIIYMYITLYILFNIYSIFNCILDFNMTNVPTHIDVLSITNMNKVQYKIRTARQSINPLFVND